jgi:hypothetical protein
MAAPKKKVESYKNTDRVTIKLDRIPGQKEQDDVVIAVNGQRFQIQRGVEVSVPRMVADALELWAREKADAETIMFQLMD